MSALYWGYTYTYFYNSDFKLPAGLANIPALQDPSQMQAPPAALDKLERLLRNGAPGGPRIMMTSEKRVSLFKELDALEIKV